jgi:hypothetical protein
MTGSGVACDRAYTPALMGGATTTLELEHGTTEQATFFGDLFGVTHLPAGEPKGGLVVCSPIFSEFLKNNRREVLLGRRLAERGFAVQRFHYRGTGNSMGASSELTLESMTEDARTAAAHLRTVVGVETPDFLGTLLGAFAAAGAADARSQIVLWDPTLDGRRYFADLLRTLVIVGMSHGIEKNSDDLEAEFQEKGRLDVAGFSLPRSLRNSAQGRKLELPAGEAPTMIVQLGRKAEVSRATQRLVDEAEAAGRPTTVEPLAEREVWWFHKDVDKLRPDEGMTLDEGMLAPTIAWLTGRESE